jgi:hypothetical protein
MVPLRSNRVRTPSGIRGPVRRKALRGTRSRGNRLRVVVVGRLSDFTQSLHMLLCIYGRIVDRLIDEPLCQEPLFRNFAKHMDSLGSLLELHWPQAIDVDGINNRRRRADRRNVVVLECSP